MPPRLTTAVIGLMVATRACWGQPKVSSPVEYAGMSDASGAVALGTRWFAVGDDETNPLRIYRRDKAGPPVKVIDFSDFLDLDPKKPELDLEAATRIGDRAYWISSHGRNKEGKYRINRHFLFATTIQLNERGADLVPVGKPYKNLLSDLLTAPQLTRFRLVSAAQMAPKSSGALNIEGLCATPDKQLLIGFRNPIPKGRALVVPLLNPDQVIEKGVRARLGDPLLLDLGGLGIRDMAYWEGTYVIIAGPAEGHGKFRLYRWSGGTAKPKVMKGITFKELTPEAIVIYPDTGLSQFQILSDDGTREKNGVPFKDLPVAQRRFRSVWVTP